MMPPLEAYLEVSLADEIKRGMKLGAVTADKAVYDIDKPWHILIANRGINTERCSALTKNDLGEGASIDDTASIAGLLNWVKTAESAGMLSLKAVL